MPISLQSREPLSVEFSRPRILEWGAMPFSRESFRPRDQTRISYVSCIDRCALYYWHHLESPYYFLIYLHCRYGIMATNHQVYVLTPSLSEALVSRSRDMKFVLRSASCSESVGK